MYQKARRYIGPPSTVGPVESVVYLLVVAGFILTLIALGAPTWKTFATPNGDGYEIGLWSACKNGACTSAWTRVSPVFTLTPDGQSVVGSWFYFDFTPSMVATAQAFYILGVFMHMLGCMCWAGGSGPAALSLLLPNIFYTVALGTAGYFFNQQAPAAVSVIKLEWGYAASCAFAALIVMWIAFFAFLVDFIVRSIWGKSSSDVYEQEMRLEEAA